MRDLVFPWGNVSLEGMHSRVARKSLTKKPIGLKLVEIGSSVARCDRTLASLVRIGSALCLQRTRASRSPLDGAVDGGVTSTISEGKCSQRRDLGRPAQGTP